MLVSPLAAVLSPFVLSVVLRLVLLLAALSDLVLAADLFLAPPLLFPAGWSLFDAPLACSAVLLRVLVLLVASLFACALPFLLAPPLVVGAVAVAVVGAVAAALSSSSSSLSRGCGSGRVFLRGNYKKKHLLL